MRRLVASIRQVQPSERPGHGRIFVGGPAMAELEEGPRREALRRIRRALEELPEFAGADVIGHSQRAGCSCGCSPGFIAKGAAGAANKWHWVDLAWASVH